jgi:hypothetical protein
MTTVAILPSSDASGKLLYRAIAGNKQAVGNTAGQALDRLTTQLGATEFRAVLLIQSFATDAFFSETQQARLAELMQDWRSARERGETLPPAQQAELDALVEAELKAATARTASLM